MQKKYVTREIEPAVTKAAGQFSVVVVTGARQTGKSTLLRHLFPDADYVTLDDPFTRQAAEDDPRTFLQRDGKLIIDEIQYLPQLLSYVKLAVDENRRSAGRYLLTGSQMFPLMEGVTESLAGRAGVFQLLPFSYRELAYQPGSIEEIFDKILQGFYPDVIVHGLDRNLYYSSYVQTYLERDVRRISTVADLSLFQRVLELLASRVGNILNINEVSKEAGVSTTTIRRWLSILESCGIIFLLRPYFKNLTSRIIKSPKLYFADTGIVSWLLRYPTSQTLMRGPQGGVFFENFVILELLKAMHNKMANFNLYYFRDSNGNEVDLLVESGDKTTLVEIKQTATPRADHFKTIKQLLPKIHNSHGVVACCNNYRETYQANMNAIPWHELFNYMLSEQQQIPNE
ncbi:MAG: ATP-binding protein [Lentisphaerae bacterium]|nr:ATP-binding protein [Lentisphaerota bacterium]